MKKGFKEKKSKIIESNKNKFTPIYIKYWKALFLIVVLIVYGQTISFDFVHLDDTKIIVDNQNKISSLSNIVDAFATGYGFDQGTPYYRPIVTLSFIIDSQFSGVKPVFYHISNFILHYLSVCFLFLLLVELKISKQIAFLLALIFAVHPVLTNAVVWIAGRNDMLAALFSILSLLYFIRYTLTLSNKNYLLHILFFLIAILSKEVALILPFLILVYLFLYQRNKLSFKYLYKFLIVWAATIVLFQIIKTIVVTDIGNLTYGIPAILNNIQVIPEILFKVFVPINISVLPTFTLTKSLIGAAFFIIIILFPFLRKSIDKKNYYFGVIWFLIFVMPGLAVYYADQSLKFDYLDSRIYLPIIGILILVGEVFKDFRIDFTNKKQLYVFSSLIILFSALTFLQSKKYKDGIMFAESAVLSNPQKPFFYHKLADYYFGVKDYQKAVDFTKSALKLDPDNYMYFKNLILAYSNLNQYNNAINAIYEALKIAPNNLELLRGLMIIYSRKGDYHNALIIADKYITLGGVIDKTFYDQLKSNKR